MTNSYESRLPPADPLQVTAVAWLVLNVLRAEGYTESGISQLFRHPCPSADLEFDSAQITRSGEVRAPADAVRAEILRLIA